MYIYTNLSHTERATPQWVSFYLLSLALPLTYLFFTLYIHSCHTIHLNILILITSRFSDFFSISSPISQSALSVNTIFNTQSGARPWFARRTRSCSGWYRMGEKKKIIIIKPIIVRSILLGTYIGSSMIISVQGTPRRRSTLPRSIPVNATAAAAAADWPFRASKLSPSHHHHQPAVRTLVDRVT